MEDLNRVFVYGTLKSGNRVRGIDSFVPDSQASLIGKAETRPEFSLWDLGAFPAASQGKDSIIGEVWSVDEETFAYLDAIEGYPDFYDRRIIKTSKGDAWIYFIKDVEMYTGVKQIPSQNGKIEWLR